MRWSQRRREEHLRSREKGKRTRKVIGLFKEQQEAGVTECVAKG